jgi:hypothetical protein
MSDGRVIEGRLAGARVRPVCLLSSVEAAILARRYGDRPVAEAMRLEGERQDEADRRAFVRALWRNRVER